LSLLIIFFLIPSSLFSSDYYTVDSDFNSIDLGTGLQYIEDKDGATSISEIMNEDIIWKHSQNNNIAFGYTQSAWWFKFNVENISDKTKEMFLKVDNPLFDNIDLYKAVSGFPRKIKSTGDQLPAETRDIQSNKFFLRLSVVPGENQYYLRIRTTSSMIFTPRLVTTYALLKDATRESSLIFFLSGWLILLILYNIFVFYSIRKVEIILFVFLVLSLLMLRLTTLGYISLYVLPPSLNNFSVVFVIISTVISCAYFIQYYFNPRKNYPFFYKTLNIGIKYPIFVIILLSPFLLYRHVLIAVNIIAAILPLYLFSLSIYASFRRNRQAYFIFIGFSIILVTVPIDGLNLFGFIGRAEIFDWFYNIGLAWLMLFSSLGLADRLTMMTKELQKRGYIIDSASSAIITSDLDGNIEYVNPTFLHLWNYSNAGELKGKDFRSFWIAEENMEAMNQSLKNIGKWTGELKAIRKNGQFFDVQVSAALVTDTQGNPKGFMSSAVDITMRNQALESLKESESKYKTVIENANDSIVVLQGRNFTFFNPRTCEVTGYSAEELAAKPFIELIHPEERKRISGNTAEEQIGNIRYETFTLRVIGKKGNVIWCEIKPVVIKWKEKAAILCFINDVTEKKQTEELMIQSEKMMSIGRLAAGTAHELNNPLAGILQGAQNIQRRLLVELPVNLEVAEEVGIGFDKLQSYIKKRKIHTLIEGIQDSGNKAAEIISNMLQFSRKSESKMIPTDLASLLKNVIDLANKEYNLTKKFDFKSIKIKKEFDPNMPMVPCNKTEIEQVFLNLLSNAAWAMANQKDNKSPQITLRVKLEGGMACTEVEDNGPGMDEETRKRIFEPFFTTKPVGEGTGLGLSVSFMFITNNHKGTIKVDSEIGKRTKFIVKLPLE